MEVRQVNISDTAQMKQEIAKETKKDPKSETNLKQTPTSEQTLFKRPYGADGMSLGKGEQYNPLSTILPDSKMEEARKKLKDDDEAKRRKKHKDKNKKKQENGSFWTWLMGDNASTAGDREDDDEETEG